MKFSTNGLIFAALIAIVLIIGCATTTTTVDTGMSAEEHARQDSIAEAQRDSLLRLNRMFAYDYLKSRNWKEARGYLWKVVKLDEANEYNVWARLYETYINENQPDSAQFVIREGIKTFPDDVYLNATLAFFLKQQGQYEEALKHYKIANLAPEPLVEYLKGQAESEEALGMGEDAIMSYERVLAMTHDDQDAKDRYTSLLKQYRDPTEYIASLKEDISNNPDDINKRMELLMTYADQSMNEEVIAEAGEIISRAPERKDPYLRKAESQENLERFSDAIATYKALLEVDAKNWRSMIRVADNYRHLKQFKSARNWVQNARDASSDAGAAADHMLGLVYESTVDACAGGNLTYDDKLIYTIAYGLFTKAAAGNDYDVKDKAANRVSYYKSANFIPVYSDWFMSQDRKMARGDCYGWINTSWQEVGYINSYLDQLSKSK
ncbi:hypothetical protein K8I28_02240 [bacterium]|nr:hypothetical protein [bacterium]